MAMAAETPPAENYTHLRCGSYRPTRKFLKLDAEVRPPLTMPLLTLTIGSLTRGVEIINRELMIDLTPSNRLDKTI